MKPVPAQAGGGSPEQLEKTGFPPEFIRLRRTGMTKKSVF